MGFLRGTFIFGVAVLVASPVYAGATAYFDDASYLDAAGFAEIINFLELPDGSPSHHGAFITPAFNYEEFGATFTAPAGFLELILRSEGDFALRTELDAPSLAWIDATLGTPCRGVAILFEGETTLSAFDADDNLLITASLHDELHGSPRHHDGGFLGIVSDIPVARLRVDRGLEFEQIHGLIMTPVPEPASAMLVGAVFALLRRPGGRWSRRLHFP